MIIANGIEFLRLDETMAMLHCSRSAIFTLIRQGKLKKKKVTGKLYFTRQEVENLFLFGGEK